MSDITPLIAERNQIHNKFVEVTIQLTWTSNDRRHTVHQRENLHSQQICENHNTTDLEIERPTSPHSPKQTQDSSGFRRAKASVSGSRSKCQTRPRGPTACLAPINLLRVRADTGKCRTWQKQGINTYCCISQKKLPSTLGRDVATPALILYGIHSSRLKKNSCESIQISAQQPPLWTCDLARVRNQGQQLLSWNCDRGPVFANIENTLV